MATVTCPRCKQTVLKLRHAVRDYYMLVDVAASPDGYLQVDEMLGTYVRVPRPRKGQGLHHLHIDTCPARLAGKTERMK